MRLWSFFGECQRRALTQDQTGVALPVEFAPWVRYKEITLSDYDEEDRRAMNAIQESGYHLYRGGRRPPGAAVPGHPEVSR